MAVSEQTDSLRVLGSDPVDYLITPRTLACMIAGPILNLMCFVMGELLPQYIQLPSCYLCQKLTSSKAQSGQPQRQNGLSLGPGSLSCRHYLKALNHAVNRTMHYEIASTHAAYWSLEVCVLRCRHSVQHDDCAARL